jgi:hypothetical protein
MTRVLVKPILHRAGKRKIITRGLHRVIVFATTTTALLACIACATRQPNRKKGVTMDNTLVSHALKESDWRMMGRGLSGGRMRFSDDFLSDGGPGRLRFKIEVAGSGVPVVAVIGGTLRVDGRRIVFDDRPGERTSFRSRMDNAVYEYDEGAKVFLSPDDCDDRLVREQDYSGYYPGDTPEVWARVREGLRSPDPRVVRESIFRTAYVSYGNKTPELSEFPALLTHADAEVRAFATWAGFHLMDSRAFARHLPDLLQDPSARVAIEARRVVNRNGYELDALSRDPDESVRELARRIRAKVSQ